MNTRTRTPDLTVKDLAEHISMHPANVSDLIRRGTFPNAYKAGRGGVSSPWRVPATDVDDYKAKNRYRP